MDRVKKYLSLVKFSHTIFAMPFALIGYFMAITKADYSFDPFVLVIIILCMIFARNSAMGFNRLADRHYDAANPRTAAREIPAGKITKSRATIFVIANSILFIIATSFLNKLALFLSPVALLVILGYSLTKRFTALCHLILGIGLSLAPIGAYLSVTGEFAFLPLIFSAIVLTWVSGFDIIYSLQDYIFDRENNLYSIPAATGLARALRISELIHLITASLVVFAGYYGNMGFLYWTGSGLFTLLLIYQHAIVKPNDLSRVNLAFGTTNGVASILYASLTILSLFT